MRLHFLDNHPLWKTALFSTNSGRPLSLARKWRTEIVTSLGSDKHLYGESGIKVTGIPTGVLNFLRFDSIEKSVLNLIEASAEQSRNIHAMQLSIVEQPVQYVQPSETFLLEIENTMKRVCIQMFPVLKEHILDGVRTLLQERMVLLEPGMLCLYVLHF